MKKILLIAGSLSLLATTGCLVSDGGGRHRHARYERHDEVIVAHPVVVVHPPEVFVRPPEIIVR